MHLTELADVIRQVNQTCDVRYFEVLSRRATEHAIDEVYVGL